MFLEAESITDIVMDMTGFDLRLVTKEELHKDTAERAVSAMSSRSQAEVGTCTC